MDLVSDETIYELIGILLGDGYILCKPSQYRVEISGNSTEELPYFQKYLMPLFQNFTNNVHLLRCHDRKGSSIRVVVNSKSLVTYLVREIGLVHGRRKTEFAEVPSKILTAEWNKVKLIIRGFADTDGSLFFGKKGTYQKHSYPTIEMRSASLKLLIQFQTILRENGFAPHLRKTSPHYGSKASFLYLSGKEQLLKWVKEIGFGNPKHLTKYQVWKKMGFCPPRTNLRYRSRLLNEPGWQSG